MPLWGALGYSHSAALCAVLGPYTANLAAPSCCSEETLRMYFSQFGAMEHAEIMKDRYTVGGPGSWYVRRQLTA